MGRFVKNYNLSPTAQYSVVVPGFNPIGSISPSTLRPQYPVEGQIRYTGNIANLSEARTLEFWANSSWKQVASVGIVDIRKDSASGDGAATVFGMPNAPRAYTAGQESQVLVFIGGVFQNPGVNYVFNGTTNITFLSPVPFGQIWVALHNFNSTSTS